MRTLKEPANYDSLFWASFGGSFGASFGLFLVPFTFVHRLYTAMMPKLEMSVSNEHKPEARIIGIQEIQ